jgi:hypothetical protein
MKTVLSYCSARAFLAGLLPMVAMRPRQAVAQNDNAGPLRLPRVQTQDGRRRHRPHSRVHATSRNLNAAKTGMEWSTASPFTSPRDRPVDGQRSG